MSRTVQTGTSTTAHPGSMIAIMIRKTQMLKTERSMTTLRKDHLMREIMRSIVTERMRMKRWWQGGTIRETRSHCVTKSSIRSKAPTRIKAVIKSLISRYPRGLRVMTTTMETVICIDNDLLN
jgi:hypothetical protein